MEAIAYKGRAADAILQRKLKSSGAVLIEGPKWCGKTTTAAQQAGSVNHYRDGITHPNIRRFLTGGQGWHFEKNATLSIYI